MLASFPDRRFQLWLYEVSHGSLLVRSPGREDLQIVDLVFVGVEYVALPRHLRGVEVEPGSATDVARASDVLRKAVADDHVFAIVSGGQRHLVVAVALRVSSHDGDIFDSPFK